MLNRRRLVALGVALLCLIGVGVVVVRVLERNHVIRAGEVVVAVEGHDLWPPRGIYGDNVIVGVGVGGVLGLVAGRCVGFENLMGGSRSAVIVWPPGTKVTGIGKALRIRSQGKTVRIGQQIQGGTDFGHDLRGIRGTLPRACRDAELVWVGLDS